MAAFFDIFVLIIILALISSCSISPLWLLHFLLRSVEPLSAVKANHLLGCSINEKMRAVLVDWLVEVQLQFKLLQVMLATYMPATMFYSRKLCSAPFPSSIVF